MKGNILISGAGPVGNALALMLAADGHEVTRIDPQPANASRHDPRALAIARASRITLETLDAYPACQVSPIEQVHVSQQGHLGQISIAATELGLPALGDVVPYGALCAALEEACRQQGIPRHQHRIAAAQADTNNIAITLDDGQQVTARLLVHADGQLDAPDARVHDYQRSALVARLRPESAPTGRAYERFASAGPLALLPQGNDYALVWALPSSAAAAARDQSERGFLDAVEVAMGQRLHFTSAKDRQTFPLQLRWRHQLTAARQVWIGNAAQRVHPISGQGFNLGLRDAAALACCLYHARDAGAASLLDTYRRNRRIDRAATVGFTHGLNQLFTLPGPLASHLRSAGLLAANFITPLRNAVIRRLIYGTAGN